MIELSDLFHENRISELTLSLILYIPIGLCLLVIRSIALVILLIISSILPASLFLDQFIHEAISFILTFIYINESSEIRTEKNRITSKIIIANRVSFLDSIALRKFLSNNKCKVVNLWRDHSWIQYFKINSINNFRTQEDLLDLCIREIQESDYQLIFLPEYMPTTGSDGLLKFNVLPFTLGKKLNLSIQPLYIRTSRAFKIRTVTFNNHPFSDLFWFLFSPYTRYHINLLPSVLATTVNSDEVLCERIRGLISKTMSIELTEFDEQQITELIRQPRIFYRRHAQRRVEFQQMINFIHQQMPSASLETIRYDLESTKSVQRTIANLNARLAESNRILTKTTSTSSVSSKSIPKSSGGSNHRQIYERLKHELIEKNRQLYLKKNCN